MVGDSKTGTLLQGAGIQHTLLICFILLINLRYNLIIAVCPNAVQPALEFVKADSAADILSSEGGSLIIQILTVQCIGSRIYFERKRRIHFRIRKRCSISRVLCVISLCGYYGNRSFLRRGKSCEVGCRR